MIEIIQAIGYMLAWFLGLICFPSLASMGAIAIGKDQQAAETACITTVWIYIGATIAFLTQMLV